MWKVTPQNAASVIVVSSSTLACALGSLTAHLITKRVLTRKYETLIETEVQQAKVYFSQRNKTGEYADPVALAERVLEGEEDNDSVEEPDESEDIEVVEERREYNRLTNNYSAPKGAAQMRSKPAPDEDMEAFEKRLIAEANAEVADTKRRLGIVEDEPEEELYEEQEEVITMNVFTEQSNRESNRDQRDTSRPYIISYDEFNNGDEDYQQNTLTYFEGDDVLVDERDQPIRTVSRVVGESNLQFGKESNDPNIVYIRNHELEVDFEVCRSNGKYTEEVLGFIQHEDAPPKVRKFRVDD